MGNHSKSNLWRCLAKPGSQGDPFKLNKTPELSYREGLWVGQHKELILSSQALNSRPQNTVY